MMLSKMQPDAGSVRVFTAVFATLVAQVFSAENVPEVTEETVNALLEVQIGTGHYIGSLVLGAFILAITYVTNSTKYGRKLNPAWKFSPAALLAAFVFFFLDLAREKTLLTLPFYLSLFGFPVSLFSGLFTIGVNSEASIFQNSFFAITDPLPIDRKEIDAALTLEGEACVKAFTAFGNDYSFDVADAKTFVNQVLKATAETTKLSAGDSETMVKALEKLKAKAQELFNADKKDAEFDAIVEILAKTKKALRLDEKDETPYFKKEDFKKPENPKQERNFVEELTEAVKKIDLDEHFQLLVDAWVANQTATPKFDVKIKALYDALIAQCGLTHFSEASDKAATSLPKLRKLIKTLKALDVTKVPSYKELNVKDKDTKTTHAFSDELVALQDQVKKVVNVVVEAKLGGDLKDLAIVKDAASTYTAATVETAFIAEFQQVLALLDAVDGVTFDALTEQKTTAAKTNIDKHITAVIALINDIKTNKSTKKADGEKVFDLLHKFDRSLYSTTDAIRKPLFEMIEEVSPAKALEAVCEAQIKTIDELPKNQSAADMVDALIAASKEFTKLHTAATNKAAKPLTDFLAKITALKDSIVKVAENAIVLPLTDQNRVTLEAVRAALEKADVPEAQFFVSSGAKESVFKADIEKVKQRLEHFTHALPLVKATEALSPKDDEFKPLCVAIKAAKELVAAADAKQKDLTELAALKTALKAAAVKVNTVINTWEAKKAKLPSTLKDLKELRAVIADAKDISAFTETEVCVSAKPDAYFAKYNDLATIQTNATEATIAALAEKHKTATAVTLKDVPIATLIADTVEILEVIPDGSNLSTMIGTFDKFEEKRDKCKEFITLAIESVKNQCEDLAKTPEKAKPVVVLLVTANLIAAEDNDYVGVKTKKIDGNDVVLFKQYIDPVIIKSKE